MKTFLSFLCGAAVMLGFSVLSGSTPGHHVYELRLYHVNQGKMDALKARFGDHTDAIFKRHNMKSIGHCVPEDAAQNLFVYILEPSEPARGGEELGRVPSRSGMEKGEGRIGSPRATGGSYRPLFRGSDQLFSAQLEAANKIQISNNEHD
jgi:hypothetical protein